MFWLKITDKPKYSSVVTKKTPFLCEKECLLNESMFPRFYTDVCNRFAFDAVTSGYVLRLHGTDRDRHLNRVGLETLSNAFKSGTFLKRYGFIGRVIVWKRRNRINFKTATHSGTKLTASGRENQSKYAENL